VSPEAAPRPVQVTPFPNGELGIVWSDGQESYYDGHALRCACPCATCVNEITGEKMLRDETVPADVHPQTIRPVGNYGLSIEWSDGHDKGIYTFRQLRSLIP